MAAMPGMPDRGHSGCYVCHTAIGAYWYGDLEPVSENFRVPRVQLELAAVTEDLAITLDHFNHGRDELKKGFQELSTPDQEYCTLYHHNDISSVISGWRDYQASQGFRSVG